jgi:hypothetical protein
MTDEEMAEEYANENWEHYEEGQNDSKALKQAFLAGLKVNVKELSTETLLKELIDRKVIRSWYYNGTYHVGNELSEEE